MNTFKTGRAGILLAALLALVAVSLPGAASAKDKNHDRIPDKWEKSNKLSLKKDQRKLDQDRDGLKNRGEFRAGTNPRDRDSDDDGITDKKEKAGIVSAYDADAQTLTISLYAGGELSGSVTEDTRVRCEGEGAGDEGSDDQGSGDVASSRHRGGGNGGPGESGDDESDDDGTADRGPGDNGEREDGHHGRHRGDCHGNCSLEDLAVDVEITEAEVKYAAGGAVFKSLEIVKVADES